MGARRRAEEERVWGILVAQLIRQIPGGSILLARQVYIQAQMAGRDIMRAYGRITDILRLLIAGLVLAFVAIALNNGAPTVQKLVVGVLLGVVSSLVLLNILLNRLDLHVGAMAANDIQGTGRKIVPVAVLVIVGQSFVTLYPVATWALNLLGIQTLGPRDNPLGVGMLIGSLLGLPLVLPIAVRLPRQVQRAVNKRLQRLVLLGEAKQMGENEPKGRSQG